MSLLGAAASLVSPVPGPIGPLAHHLVTEQNVASVIDKVGLWWPLADEVQIAKASAACRQVAHALRDCAAAGSTAAGQITRSQDGGAVSAFTASWAKYDGPADAVLPAHAKAADQLADALEDFANEVVDAKNKVRSLATDVGTGIIVSAVLAPFTAGAAVAGGAFTAAGAVGRGFLLRSAYASALRGIMNVMRLAELGAIDGFATSIISQALKAEFAGGDGIDLHEALVWGGTGAVAGPVLGGVFAAGRAYWRHIWQPELPLPAAPSKTRLPDGARVSPRDASAHPVTGAIARFVRSDPPAAGVDGLPRSIAPLNELQVHAYFQSLPRYASPAHHTAYLTRAEFDELKIRIERAKLGHGPIEDPEITYAIPGRAPAVGKRDNLITVHININATNARLAEDAHGVNAGNVPVMFAPNSKFLVKHWGRDKHDNPALELQQWP